MDFRSNLIGKTVIAEQSDIEDETDFIKVDDVSDMLNELETRINDVKGKLDKISGLTEIDEIKELIDQLSTDLY